MPKISLEELESLIDSEEEFEDRREIVRLKEAKNHFKEDWKKDVQAQH
jgi:hypothetical protein